MMRTRFSLYCAIALVAAIHGLGQAEVESGSSPEPWAGYWWPQYCTSDSSCPHCPWHLWSGSLDSGDYDGPIFDLDTKYFWWPLPKRDSARDWEYAHHRTTGSTHDGHCCGLASASVLEGLPPSDCGALSQFDLKGLLTELYYSSAGEDLTPYKPALPSDIWLACQYALKPAGARPPHAYIADFDTSHTECNWYAVYGYHVLYVVSGNGMAQGWLTLHIEERYDTSDILSGTTTGNRPESLVYRFDKVEMRGDAPRPHTGEWIGDPGPEKAILPENRVVDTFVNTCLCTTEIRQVIDHKTIICDDAWATGWTPHAPPGDSWEQRPGYGGTCWAAPGSHWVPPDYRVFWLSPRLRDGLWNLYAYKTPPAPGDVVSQHTPVERSDGIPITSWFNQAEPPADSWKLVDGPFQWTHPSQQHYVSVWANYDVYPLPCKVYLDALKLEWVGEEFDGETSRGSSYLTDVIGHLGVAPNPTVNVARIRYEVAKPGRIDIVVFDVAGRAVMRSSQGYRRSGLQTASLRVSDLPAGMYLARVNIEGGHANTAKFIVQR
jgi:hypothetical protein